MLALPADQAEDLGTHPGAGQHAQLVRQWSDDVVFFAHTYDLTAGEREQLDALGIRVVDGEVGSLVVDADRLAGVQLVDGRVIERTAVFIRPGNLPHPDGLLAGLGCEVDDAGFVTVDRTGRTSTIGVWAAGNVVDPRAQVITAAGAGSAAAIAINADLVRTTSSAPWPPVPSCSFPPLGRAPDSTWDVGVPGVVLGRGPPGVGG